MSARRRSPKEILQRPYSRVLIPDEESGTYTAQILEFPGCVSEGDSPSEAYERLEKVAESWIRVALDLGQEIPEPAVLQEYSGRVLVRFPKSVHRRAAEYAERDGTSLNQFIVAAVSEKIGERGVQNDLRDYLENFMTSVSLNCLFETLENISVRETAATSPTESTKYRLYGSPFRGGFLSNARG